MPDRPQEMYTNGRSAVDVFDPQEEFYHRVHPEAIQPDDTVLPVHVPCPDLSSNRSKFSRPHYVLYPRATNGMCAVFKFYLEEVPGTVASPDSGGGTPVQYAVRTVHAPFDDNYGHCETRLYRGEQHMRPNKVSPGAKKIFREHMSRILRLERPPGLPF